MQGSIIGRADAMSSLGRAFSEIRAMCLIFERSTRPTPVDEPPCRQNSLLHGNYISDAAIIELAVVEQLEVFFLWRTIARYWLLGYARHMRAIHDQRADNFDRWIWNYLSPLERWAWGRQYGETVPALISKRICRPVEALWAYRRPSQALQAREARHSQDCLA